MLGFGLNESFELLAEEFDRLALRVVLSRELFGLVFELVASGDGGGGPSDQVDFLGFVFGEGHLPQPLRDA